MDYIADSGTITPHSSYLFYFLQYHVGVLRLQYFIPRLCVSNVNGSYYTIREDQLRIWGSYVGCYKEFCLLVYKVAHFVESQQIFRRYIPPLPLGLKNMPGNKKKIHKSGRISFDLSSNLKMEEVYLAEASVFLKTARCYKPAYHTLHNLASFSDGAKIF